jgi:hypothetical protein
MRHDLFELLSDHPIIHPTRVDGISWHGRTLTISVRGYRWRESSHSGLPSSPEAGGTFAGWKAEIQAAAKLGPLGWLRSSPRHIGDILKLGALAANARALV